MASTRIEAVDGVIRVKAAGISTDTALVQSGAQTIDGIALVAGDLVLDAYNATAALAKIFVVRASTWDLVVPSIGDGLCVEVLQGTVNADKTFKQTATISDWSADGATWSDQGSGGGGGMVTLTGTQSLSNKTFTTTLTVTPTVSTSGVPKVAVFTGAIDTGQTASTEKLDFYVNLARTITWATGALTTQRFALFRAPTLAFVGASTVTKTATVAIEAAPTAGANATLTNAYALWVQAGISQFDGAVAATDDIGWTGAAGKQVTLTQGIGVTGSPYALKVIGGAHTTLTASTEAKDAYFNLARTVQFATGALTTQRAFYIDAPTYGFVGASTITNAATFAISGPPVAGTNATLTNTYSLWVQTGASQFDGLCRFAGATATPAAGSAAASIRLGSTTATLGIYYGSGAPTVSAGQGSIYIRTDGSSTSTRQYINTDGGTTWTAVTTAA